MKQLLCLFLLLRTLTLVTQVLARPSEVNREAGNDGYLDDGADITEGKGIGTNPNGNTLNATVIVNATRLSNETHNTTETIHSTGQNITKNVSEIPFNCATQNSTETDRGVRLNNATHNVTEIVSEIYSDYSFQNTRKTASAGIHTNNGTHFIQNITKTENREGDSGVSVDDIVGITEEIKMYLNDDETVNITEIVRETYANYTVQSIAETVIEVPLSNGAHYFTETVREDPLNNATHNNAEPVRQVPLNNSTHNSTKTVYSTGQNVTETAREIPPNNATHNITETVHSTQNATENALQEFAKRLFKLRAKSYYSHPSGLSCSACSIFMAVTREFWSRPGITRALASHFVISACISLRIQHPDVCIGIVREFKKEFYSIFGNGVSSRGICSAILDQRCGDEDVLDKPWSVVLPKTRKPPVQEPSPAEPGSPVLKVLHLTDLHIDLNYQENTSSSCGEPLCCRESNGAGDAGYWGSYGCDVPLRTLESALRHVKLNNNDISYIILTGDIPPHDVWLDTKSSQIEVMQKAFRKIKEYFPDKKVFVAVGNHDTHPTNSFPPPSVSPELSIQWLLDTYADMWSAWLPNTSLHTVRKGGYFTVLVSPGFRIVSINNNYCNKLNWWLLLNNTDPAGELQWLIDVLQNAEDNQEKVHIIAHIPTGINICYKYWSWNYYKIIDRYENTVTAQFCGHTHQDHFEIFYDLNDHSRPTSVMYIAPSLTTNNAYQPAYRIYEVEGHHNHSSRRVLNHKTYKLDLEKSNKDRKAYWELEYSAKDAYDMKSARPRDWNDLVTRMEKDDDLFKKFYKFKYRYPKQESCDNDCKTRQLCALKTARSHDNTFCETTAEHVIF